MFIDFIYQTEKETECSTKYLGDILLSDIFKCCFPLYCENILNLFCSALIFKSYYFELSSLSWCKNQINFGKLLVRVILLLLDDFTFRHFIDRKVSYL